MWLDFECASTSRLLAMTTSMTIQQAAAATGLSVHTLRYYERIGLLDAIPRRANTHRVFREEDIRWIDFLLKLRSTGLPIRDMLRYAEWRRAGNTSESVAARKALLTGHTQSVQQTLAELQRNLDILQMKIRMYEALEQEAGMTMTSPTSEDIQHDSSQTSNPRQHAATPSRC
jgi:DNA-binding transcriptional MerR regulator